MFNFSLSKPIIGQFAIHRVRFVKETPGYKGIAAAVLRTSGVKLPMKSGPVQAINRQLKAGKAVVYRQTTMILDGGEIVATNNRRVRLAFQDQGYVVDQL